MVEPFQHCYLITLTLLALCRVSLGFVLFTLRLNNMTTEHSAASEKREHQEAFGMHHIGDWKRGPLQWMVRIVSRAMDNDPTSSVLDLSRATTGRYYFRQSLRCAAHTGCRAFLRLLSDVSSLKGTILSALCLICRLIEINS